MRGPLVSIIIPVYNGANYLKEAIDSALAQTYPNVEIIVINDGSCDYGATEKIAQSFGERIRYFAKENGGVATALNYGIERMKGEYFSWLSHDDLYYPSKIEKQIKALHQYGDMTAIVHGDYDLLEVNSQAITQVQQSKMFPREQLTNSVFPVLQGFIHGCSVLIHKSHFHRVGVFNEKLPTTQDYDLWFRMLRYQKTVYINEPMGLVRLHDTQGTRTNRYSASYSAEQCQLRIDFIKALTAEEMSSMYGSPYNFYHKMSCYFKGENMKEAYFYVNEKFQEEDVPDNLPEQLSVLQNYLQELSGGKADRICIFCAGDYGIRLYQELRSKLIPVDCFSDNNPKKWGYLLDNIYCIPPKQLEDKKEHTLVIVATRTPTEIVRQLKLLGFPFVVTKQEIDGVLLQVPPVKWTTALEDIKELDYSSEDVLLLINKFNQTIFDICKYYEDRLENALKKKES